MGVPSFSVRGGGGGGGWGGGVGHDEGEGRRWAASPRGMCRMGAAPLGGMRERCKRPHRGLGQSPRSQRFLHSKTPKTTQKKKKSEAF